MVEKLRYIKGRFYWYDCYWQKTAQGWKKRTDYLRPASSYGANKLAAGLVGFGITALFKGVPWHDPYKQIDIRMAVDRKAYRERHYHRETQEERQLKYDKWAYQERHTTVAGIQYHAAYEEPHVLNEEQQETLQAVKDFIARASAPETPSVPQQPEEPSMEEDQADAQPQGSPADTPSDAAPEGDVSDSAAEDGEADYS
jgi:hypothetical protein